jgi:antitoxin component of RelBE/YafQ-DinJ toxin-antitoxin module
MLNKKRAINVLMSEEVDDGLITVANNLGISKSRAVRFICMDYLMKQKVLPVTESMRFQNL